MCNDSVDEVYRRRNPDLFSLLQLLKWLPMSTSKLSFPATNWSTVLHTALFLFGSAGIVGGVIFDEVRIAVTAIVFCLLFAAGRIDIRLSILGMFVFLTLLGDIRRLLVPVVGWSGSDPILMVGPVFTVLVLAFALLSRRISLESTLSKWVLLFSAIMVLQIFNPKQGGLMVGIAGAILIIVPTFWFWIGQVYGSKQLLHTLFFYIIVPLAALAMVMGLVQLVYGYLPYQLEWYRIAGYSALGNSEDTLRPISILANIAEYLQYISIAVVALFASILHGNTGSKLKQAAFLLLPCGIISLLLAGSRGPVVMTVLLIVLMWAIQGETVKSWIPRLVFAGFLGVLGFVWSVNQASTISGSERVQANLDRQAELLETGGTASIHANLAWTAIYHGTVKHPLGMGVGSITLAASKFGGGGFNSEKDITNMFIAGGLMGGIAYLIVVGVVAWTAIQYWIRTRSLIALVLFGVLAVTGLSWLKPGHYVVTPLVWFLIGVLDSLSTSQDRSRLPQ